jgi:hypothetical protein
MFSFVQSTNKHTDAETVGWKVEKSMIPVFSVKISKITSKCNGLDG